MGALSDSFYDPDGPAAHAIPAEELEARAARLQAAMRDATLDGVIATANADVLYLSGTIQQAQLYVPVEGRPLLMVRKHHGRALMASKLGDSGVVAVRSLRELPALIESAGGGRRPARIGFEWDTLPVSVYNAYAKAIAPLGAELVDASMLFRQVRAIKSDYEIEQIRLAARVSEAALQAAAAHLREGATELEVASQVEAAARLAGHSGTLHMRAYGQEMHMGHLLAGESGSVPSFMNSPTGGHGPGPWAPYGASLRRIQRGEPVFLDYTGEWGGYIADQTRMLSIGPLSAFWQDAYAAMLDVQTYVEREVRPGTTSGELYEMAVSRAAQLGYGDNFMGPTEEESPGQKVPFVGHGVGLELDEWPPLQRGTDAVLQTGMVLAFEPKLIYPGKGAIGIEDTYLLTTEGLVPLTFSTRDIVVV
jgi:Xaa-Pro dipeptidase